MKTRKTNHLTCLLYEILSNLKWTVQHLNYQDTSVQKLSTGAFLHRWMGCFTGRCIKPQNTVKRFWNLLKNNFVHVQQKFKITFILMSLNCFRITKYTKIEWIKKKDRKMESKIHLQTFHGISHNVSEYLYVTLMKKW